MNAAEPRSANDLAIDRTDFAAQRTVMAAERNLMAWIRTALSMISFGFTIYKLLQGFQDAGQALPREETPRNIGLFLTGLGTLSILLGVMDYCGTIRQMRRTQHFRYVRPSFVVALILAAAGLFLFFVIYLRAL
jgi:putative membrane protein